MNPIVKTGLIFGATIFLWTLINGFAGWYKDAGMAWIFQVGAIVIEIAMVVWGLSQTAKQGRRYGGQIVAGLGICAIAGVLIVVGSLVFSYVLFPDAQEAMMDMAAQGWAKAGMSDQDIEQMLATSGFMFTPMAQALFGFAGTLLTGLVISLIAAAFLRAKE